MQEKHSATNSAETPLIEISEISAADAVAYEYKDYHAKIQRHFSESGSAPPVGNPVGVVVQWLDYLAVTQEPGVRFPATAEKCHLMWRCPSGHGIN